MLSYCLIFGAVELQNGVFRLNHKRELVMVLSDQSVFATGVGPSTFAYGFALFTDLLVASLSAAHLMMLLLDARRKRRALCMLGEVRAGPQLPPFSLPNIFHGIVIGLLLSILLRTVPDVLWLLAEDRPTKETIRLLSATESVCNTAALFPFVISLALLVWSGQVIPQQLMQAATIKLARPQLEDARPFVWPALIVLAIAAGVAIAKAHG